MTQPALPVSLADIQRQYEEALAKQGGAPAPAAAAPLAPPPSAQPAPQTPPAGFYQASDGHFYPLASQPQAAPAPAVTAAPAPLAPAAAPLPSGFSIPPQQAQALATQHAQQTLPINPPEAQQALLPEAQAVMPEPKKKRGGGRKPATTETQAQIGEPASDEIQGADLLEAIRNVVALLPKGCSLTVTSEG